MSDHAHHEGHHGGKIHPDHHDDDRRITYFATTHTRGKREMFGIRAIDRGKHVYVIGKTGMGKSTMLENMAIQDIQNGEGIAFIDPHGSTAEKLLDFIPQSRIKDVVYFAPFDTDFPLGFNVMEDVGYDKRHLVVSGLMGALKRIWVDAWSARMEYILQNTLLALLEYPDSTLLDVNRMLTNKTFRNAVIEKITDPIVKAFWVEEFAGFTDTYTREATPAIQNKIGQFTANPLIRNIVGQAHSSFDLRKIMDEKKIFIVNLSKGRMGETNASLLGSMLTVKIYLAAMSRADEPAARIARLPRFYFYVDEFQSMMNEAFADILSESRKYKLALTLANQYIEQMEEEVRDAVFGNVGTLIVFRVGPFDAEVLETVFKPTFLPEDLVGLGLGQIYLTLMIDGVGSAPFSAETIPPIEAPAISYRDDVVESSRAQYGRIRAEVESAINSKQLEFVPPPKEKKERRDGPRGGVRDQGTEPRSLLAGIVKREEPRPAAPPVREPQPQSQQHAAPRRQEAPRPNEAVARNSLKEAIERARAESAGSAAPAAPSKSPLEVLRDRREQKEARAGGEKPNQNREPRREEPRQAQPKREESRKEEPKREERKEEPRPQLKEIQQDHAHAEVSHRTLQEVLNGHKRDYDDL
ncbi:MAG: type IV secretion system DNA-binding domain-containing protein [Candidatus Kaiserbacteria bacterium]|nr:type IV secretion system DNA-binding domain-containing protein [Candidatus Kaiserbacteria bacterium]